MKTENDKKCSYSTNKQSCNCSYPCDKKGICCECISYHKSRGEVPACFFPDEVERTYNRTIENFIRGYQK